MRCAGHSNTWLADNFGGFFLAPERSIISRQRILKTLERLVARQRPVARQAGNTFLVRVCASNDSRVAKSAEAAVHHCGGGGRGV